MPSIPIRVGLVGLSAKGLWESEAHIGYLSKTSHYKIVAPQNSSKASAEAAAAKYNLTGVATYGSPDDLAADPNVDMVIVSVKVPDHLHLTEPALHAKKDVFVEWPLGRSLAEAEHLTNLACDNGVKTLIGLQARQSPTVRKAKAMVAAGELGAILGTTMNATGMVFGPAASDDYLYLYMNAIENGANLVTIPAGHALDALCFVLGEFASPQATLAKVSPTEILLTGITDATSLIHPRKVPLRRIIDRQVFPYGAPYGHKGFREECSH